VEARDEAGAASDPTGTLDCLSEDTLMDTLTVDTVEITPMASLSASNSLHSTPTTSASSPKKRRIRQVKFKPPTRKTKRYSPPLHTPPLTRGARKLSTASNQPPSSPSPTTHDQQACEQRQAEINQLKADNKSLWSAVARLQSTLQEQGAKLEQQEVKQEEEVSTRSLAENIAAVEDVVIKRLEVTDKKIEGISANVSSLERRHNILRGSVDSLTITVETLSVEQQQMKTSMEDGYKKHTEMEARLAALAGVGASPPTYHESTLAFHLSGLHILRQCLKQQLGQHADPVAIIVKLLKDVGANSCINRIQLVGPNVKEDRLRARSALVYMTSSFHKNEALIRIKSLLVYHRLQEVTVEGGRFRDHTPPASYMMEEKESAGGGRRPNYAEAAAGDSRGSGSNTTCPPSPPSSFPDTGLSMGGNVCLATSSHQTQPSIDHPRGQKEDEVQVVEVHKGNLSPRSILHDGGERQRPRQSSNRPGSDTSDKQRSSKLMQLAGYQKQPHFQQQQNNTVPGYRPRAQIPWFYGGPRATLLPTPARE